jgi:hypothetical protein
MPPQMKKTVTKTKTKTTARNTPAKTKTDGPKTKADPKSETKAKRYRKSRAKPKPNFPPEPKATAKRKSRVKAEPEPMHDLKFSREWMTKCIDTAILTGSIEEGCRVANVSIAVFLRGRREDPNFDTACRLHEEVADLRITDTLCTVAMNGDIRSQSLYFARVRERNVGNSTQQPADECLSAAEAEAALRAVLEVREAIIKAKAQTKTKAAEDDVEEEDGAVPPSPSPSRSEPQSYRDSVCRDPW